MAIADPVEATRFWLHDTTVPPLFTDAQIQEFLDLEKVIDADGYAPSNDDWTPTYDVISAAGRGWLWKAGEVSNKAIEYRVGDVWVTIDKQYCINRARELLGAKSGALQRRDEQTDPDELARYRTG